MMLLHKKMTVTLAAVVASVFLMQEVSYAWIAAAAGAVRRVRKNHQNQQQQGKEEKSAPQQHAVQTQETAQQEAWKTRSENQTAAQEEAVAKTQ